MPTAETDQTWDVRRLLDWSKGYLERKGDEHPLLSAQWLVGDVTGFSRIELYTNLEYEPNSLERATLHDYLLRRAQGEPLQYIIGKAAFRHIVVDVTKDVLIPRPETEVLVSEVLDYLKTAQAGEEGLLVADICTGSGCIACSLAYEAEDVQVIATDISAPALAVAQRTTDRLKLHDKVAYYEGNLGEAVPTDHIGHLDAVVSNPPYVPSAVMTQLPEEVASYEPTLALEGGDDGLDLFRPLTVWAFNALKPGGMFAVELHETCLETARDFAVASGFSQPRIVEDLTGRPRILAALR